MKLKGKRSSGRALAKKAGVSESLVSTKRARGKADSDILAEAAKTHRRAKTHESYADAQARKETALADLREMEARRQKSELLDADDVRAAVVGMITSAKSRLLTMADELCDRLAACSDPIGCRVLVDSEVRRALTALSKSRLGETQGSH
jgi:hypothetical protein